MKKACDVVHISYLNCVDNLAKKNKKSKIVEIGRKIPSHHSKLRRQNAKIKTGHRNKRMTVTFRKFTFDGNSLQYVKTFKYLGHIITDTFSDDDDIHREIRNMFIRTNILIRPFAKCSVDVKIILFRAHCICLYDAGLWSRYKTGSFNKLLSCYNKCLQMFFGFKRRDSMTLILFDFGLPSFNTIMHNSKVVLVKVFVVAPMLLSDILIVYCRICVCFCLSLSLHTVVFISLVA